MTRNYNNYNIMSFKCFISQEIGTTSQDLYELQNSIMKLFLVIEIFSLLLIGVNIVSEKTMNIINEQKNVIKNVKEGLNIKGKKLLTTGFYPMKHNIFMGASFEAVKIDISEIIKTNDEKGIGENIFVRNIEFIPQGESSSLICELINKSDNDYFSAEFKIKLYKVGNDLLGSYDFYILDFKSRSIKEINKLLFGIEAASIAKCEIIITSLNPSSYEEKTKQK